MRPICIIVFFFFFHSFFAQKEIKYKTLIEGKVFANNVSNNWSITDCIINDKDTLRFFFMPFLRLMDLNNPGVTLLIEQLTLVGNNETLLKAMSAYGIFISSKEELNKFAESLVYFGNTKGKVNERIIINDIMQNVIYMTNNSPYVNIGSRGNLKLRKKDSINAGKEILKYLDFLN
jgi:hypothetical protein